MGDGTGARRRNETRREEPGSEAEAPQRALSERLARAHKEVLAETLGRIASSPDLDRLVEQALQALTDQLDAWAGSLWLTDRNPPVAFHCLRQSGVPEDGRTGGSRARRERAHPLSGAKPPRLVMETPQAARPEACEDPSRAPFPAVRRRLLAMRGVRSLLVVPLVRAGEGIGALVALYRSPRANLREDLDLALALAPHAVLAARVAHLAQRARQAAVLDERNRIAREVHDTVAQAFTAILLELRVAQRIAGERPEEARELMQHVVQLAQQGLADARRCAWSLQPGAREYGDLVAALSKIVRRAPSGVDSEIELHVRGTPRPLAPEVGLNLARIAEEALGNALRHGQARMVWLELAFGDDRILLRVQDDGVGFDAARPEANGFGLESMRQRAELLGGEAVITSQPGSGTTVAVSVPAPLPAP